MTVIGSSRALQEFPLPDSDDLLRLGWAALTDVGRRRPHNEDSLLASPPLFVVADGMGGHSAGDFASAAVVTRLAERITGPFISAGDVEEALRTAEADIALVSRHSLLGTGTTVTGVALTLVDGQPHFLVFNIGDSRVYSWRGNRLEQVTIDHSVVQSMVDAGTLTRDQAERHPDSNMITRAIGFADPPIPDYWLIRADAGLRLVVCSDGLNGELLDVDMRALVGSGEDAASTARTLVDAALEHGGRDNVSVIVVDVFGAADAEAP